jgi:hypothetical protein
MIRLLIISILLDVILCFTIPDEFCKHKYFDSIIWTGFYDQNNKSFYGFENKLFSQSIMFDMYLKTIKYITVFSSQRYGISKTRRLLYPSVSDSEM